MKVIETIWFTTLYGTCGITIIEEDRTGDRKAYISTVEGKDEKIDEDRIVAFGQRLPLSIVEGLYYQLSPAKKKLKKHKEEIHS